MATVASVMAMPGSDWLMFTAATGARSQRAKAGLPALVICRYDSSFTSGGFCRWALEAANYLQLLSPAGVGTSHFIYSTSLSARHFVADICLCT